MIAYAEKEMLRVTKAGLNNPLLQKPSTGREATFRKERGREGIGL
jgi:hypothetical protein|tara:strand:- start:699 stop:833 length:135 start_codon:yes stop_codon:yes gene_type:complete